MAYIPNKLYCGFKSESSDALVAFMTPLAEDSAFDKRKKSVDSWRDKNLQVLELDNIPMLGFRFVDTSRRWNNNNVVFRVIHPGAGAEFEISAENLSMLMETCDIIKGEITEKLLLIRDGSKNILVPENSELHLGAAKVDEKGREIYVDKSLVHIGSNITVKSLGNVVNFGKEIIHTCRINVEGNGSGYYNPRNISFEITAKSYDDYIFFSEEQRIIHSLTSRPKVLAVNGMSNLTKDDLINKTYKYCNEKVYAYGDISNKKFKNALVKFNPADETYNSSYHLLRTNTGQLHIGCYNTWHKTFTSFGEVIFDEYSDKLLPVSGNTFISNNTLQVQGTDFFYIIKVQE